VLFAIVALVTLPLKESSRMTRAEQETIIRYSPDEDVVHVFTAHPPTHRKLAKARLPRGLREDRRTPRHGSRR
jgi:hypothetical protein